MRVGFIGLGAMGLPMARNLRSAGFEVVVHNRSRGKVDDFVAAGGEAASTPAEMAANVDVVCACLPIPPVCDEVFLGVDGVIEGASRRPALDRLQHQRAGHLAAHQRRGRRQGLRLPGRAHQRRRLGRRGRHPGHHGGRRGR